MGTIHGRQSQLQDLLRVQAIPVIDGAYLSKLSVCKILEFIPDPELTFNDFKHFFMLRNTNTAKDRKFCCSARKNFAYYDRWNLHLFEDYLAFKGINLKQLNSDVQRMTELKRNREKLATEIVEIYVATRVSFFERALWKYKFLKKCQTKGSR
mmetsp:Transcript_3235/g.4688  ORF Transcript_3235/g.4688 Transcript_3235/m.4688 type:complete len:153 (+) Transcript_3235:135-593(+)